VLLVILILGGGRTSFWGLIFACVTYLIFLNQKYFLPFVYGMVFIIATYYSFTVLFNAPNQFERLLTISESDKIVDDYRSETYELYWNSFKENPIFGKGIGFVSLDIPNKEFVLQQLKAGGHGAYLSILAIFGLAGGAFLSTFLFGTIFIGFRNIKRYYSQSNFIDQERLILFTLFYLTTISVYYLTSFSGFNDMSLYFTSGIICGLTVKYQNTVNVSI
jgi:O-antigen ligase